MTEATPLSPLPYSSNQPDHSNTLSKIWEHSTVPYKDKMFSDKMAQ